MEINDTDRVNSITKMLRYQFPDSPEGKLWLDVIVLALRDAISKKPNYPKSGRAAEWRMRKDNAINFLQGDIEPATMCGVRPEWVRSIIKDGGIILPENPLFVHYSATKGS